MIIEQLREKKYHTLFIEHINNHPEYSFLKILGVGSYGVTYLIQQVQTKRKYVLKRLRIKHKNNDKTKQQFQQEIAFLKKEMDPHFPSVQKLGELKGLPYFIMDFMEGHTFEHLIFNMNRTFSLDESLKIVKQLLELVLILHHAGIIHRDLRIPNILQHDGELYIIDFGLACNMKEDLSLDKVKNPKKIETYISDLYCIGHFLLYLLYSSYTPVKKKEKSWQEELQLPKNIQLYIERLLLIQPGFANTLEAYEALPLDQN